MRIGIFGGSFDPIHWGHLRIAQAIQGRFDLDEVRLIPSAIPPHKPSGALASFEHRMAMVALAIADIPGLVASDMEGRRHGVSFTIDTVRQFRDEASPDTDLFFIVGLDAFLEMDSWKSYPALFQSLTLVVADRPGVDAPTGALASRAIEFAVNRISSDYRLAPSEDRLDHPKWPSVYLYEATTVDVSSTRVRDCIARKRPLDALVPPAVADYISNEGLYR